MEDHELLCFLTCEAPAPAGDFSLPSAAHRGAKDPGTLLQMGPK